MKKSLLLYLLIIVALTNIFTYKYFSEQTKAEIKKNEQTKTIIDSLDLKLMDADYFSLEKDQNAQNYFENTGTNKMIDYEKLIPVVTEKLTDFNSNPNGNPFTGQDPINGKKFIINKTKLINHRWIIADFSNGENWGETLLKYFIDENEQVSFEIITTVLYAK